MAWTAGKAIVLFKDDARSEIDGLDNPLVAGLGGFRLVNRFEDVPPALHRALTQSPPAPLQVAALPAVTRQAVERGLRLHKSYQAENPPELIQTIIELFDEFHAAGQPS
jgi:hypothetical protein